MKRAIYLDDRERDLARRVCGAFVSRLNWRIKNRLEDSFDKMALGWTVDEVEALAAKFEEPTPKDD